MQKRNSTVKPFKKRRMDWFFLAVFSCFAATSFLAYNLPYLIMPLLTAARMWRPDPFER